MAGANGSDARTVVAVIGAGIMGSAMARNLVAAGLDTRVWDGSPAAAAALADAAIFTSDNPRSEDPLAILAAMLEGAVGVPARRRAHVAVEPDRATAIGQAVALAGKGDVVLVAGKGHEKYQVIGDRTLPFDDVEVARAALARRRSGSRVS